MKPVRIQRKRRQPKSDRLPDHKRRSYIDSLAEAGLPIDDITDEELTAELDRIIYVGRPTKWGNPWPGDEGWTAYGDTPASDAVVRYGKWLRYELACEYHKRPRIMGYLHELRGKNLCCWCPLDQPCHADVLLELANEEASQ